MQISAALLFFAVYFHSPAETKQKCSHTIVFQKILGLRPMQTRNSTDEAALFPLYAASRSTDEVVNAKCARLCREDPVCYGYLLVFSQNTCYGYTSNQSAVGQTRYDHIDENNHQLVPDVNAAFFVKSCLDVSPKCATSKLFPIMTIPGASLVGQNFIQLPKLASRTECINACLQEQRFACRSARFVHSYRNNQHRLWTKIDKVQLGQCFLSQANKFTNPESFTYGWEDEDYMENQCHDIQRSHANCSFEQNQNNAFIYADDSMIVSGERSCSERCLNEDRFACLGYTYYNTSRSGRSSTCFLHSDDLISLGPKAVRVVYGSMYARRVQCLLIDAQCQGDRLEVGFNPISGFHGRMSLNTPNENCSQITTNLGREVLTIATGNELIESRCGIRRAFIKGDMNNFLIFAYVYLQQDPVVRTQSDRLLKMGCIHRSSNTTILMNNMPMKSTVDFIPHSQSFSFGSIEINNGTAKIAKHVTIKLVDVETQTEVFEAILGQLIEMRIVSKNFDFDLMPYDIHALSNSETLQLLNEKGCPLNRKLFTGFRKQKTRFGVTLRTRFHAFMFPSSTALNFRLKVKFCYESCPKVVCIYQ
ncbi:uncharacterized protein LOC131676561 [Topomyia yanbarensis]|uniref:uncharacterized protein LOC131676561 n=1 Tax=Topomyia yanbarensis TaxID=2498891 RepID=UPI00273A9102|nr:uncharacterized protein LOC131676561 [Topomyia yanbarensis]